MTYKLILQLVECHGGHEKIMHECIGREVQTVKQAFEECDPKEDYAVYLEVQKLNQEEMQKVLDKIQREGK